MHTDTSPQERQPNSPLSQTSAACCELEGLSLATGIFSHELLRGAAEIGKECDVESSTLYRNLCKAEQARNSSVAQILPQAELLYRNFPGRVAEEAVALLHDLGATQAQVRQADEQWSQHRQESQTLCEELLDVAVPTIQTAQNLPSTLHIEWDRSGNRYRISRLFEVQEREKNQLIIPLEEGWRSTGHQASHLVQHLTHIELPLGEVSPQERDTLFREVSASVYFQLFPTSIPAEFHIPGYTRRWGGSSHHSGEIDGKLVVLHDGAYAAIIAHYENSDYRTESSSAAGKFPIADIAQYLPSWSAKGGCWDGPELAPLSTEDEEFLSSLGIPLDVRED